MSHTVTIYCEAHGDTVKHMPRSIENRLHTYGVLGLTSLNELVTHVVVCEGTAPPVFIAGGLDVSVCDSWRTSGVQYLGECEVLCDVSLGE